MSEQMIELIARELELGAWAALGTGDTLAYKNRRTSSLRKARRVASVIAGKVAERREVDDLCAKVEADAVSGLRYIEAHYGRLEGVGWDRVFDAHDELFRKSAALAPYPERRSE